MTEAEFLEAMRGIPPLAKPHVWNIANRELWQPGRQFPTERIKAVARMTGCVGVPVLGGAYQRVYVEAACSVATASRGRPGGCKLALATIPYVSSPPGTDPRTIAPGLATNPDLREFIANVREALGWIAEWGNRNGSTPPVGWFWLNAENLIRREPGQPDAAAWNAALKACHDAYYNACKQLAPAAHALQYERLGVTTATPSRPRNWIESNYYPQAAKGDSTTISLYTLPDPSLMVDCLAETAARAAGRSEPVVPFISLASGFDPLPGAPFRPDWDYEPRFSWMMGAMLNRASAVPAVAIYPPPFDVDTPAWGKHFAAYCRGAAGLAAK